MIPISFIAKLHSLQADVRRWGWLRSLFMRVMSGLRQYAGIHICRVGVRPLARDTPRPILPSGIHLRIVRPEELLDAADDPDLHMDRDFVRAALARGDMAFGAFEGDRLVGYSWRSFTAAPHFESLWAGVGRPYFCGYKAFTRPSHRGQRIHVAVALFSDTFLLDRGYAAEVGLVDVANYASLRTADVLGRRKIGYAGYVKLFGRCIPFRTAAVRKIGLELFEHDSVTARSGSPTPAAPGRRDPDLVTKMSTKLIQRDHG